MFTYATQTDYSLRSIIFQVELGEDIKVSLHLTFVCSYFLNFPLHDQPIYFYQEIFQMDVNPFGLIKILTLEPYNHTVRKQGRVEK